MTAVCSLKTINSPKTMTLYHVIMKKNILNKCSTDTAPDSQAREQQQSSSMYRKNAKIYEHLKHEMRMSESQSKTLSFLLSNDFNRQWQNTSPANACEDYFGFWGFTSTEKTRDCIMHVIEHVFKPRILYTNNFDDTHFETICVVRGTTASALKCVFEKCNFPESPATNEEALLSILELFNMSSDIIRFDHLLNAPMVASIDRLQQAHGSSYGNLMHPCNSDFYELYKFKLSQRDENASVKLLTGYELSRDSMCRLSTLVKTQEANLRHVGFQLSCSLKTLKMKNEELQLMSVREDEARRNDVSRFNTARLVVALKNIGDISEETSTKLLQALRIRTVPVKEILKMKSGDRQHNMYATQEILVHVPSPHVRILQRPAINPASTENVYFCDRADSDVAQQVAT